MSIRVSLERRRVLGWIGLTGLAPVWLAGSSATAAGKEKPEGSKPASPPAPAPNPGNAEPSDDARDLAALARRRYGEHLDSMKLDDLTKALDRGVQGAAELRKAKLGNGDEPDFVFRAEP